MIIKEDYGKIYLVIILFVLFKVISIYFFIKLLKNAYLNFVTINRNRKYKKITQEEMQLVEDAKELIKCFNKNIVIADFNVYKVYLFNKGWFYYDVDTKELNIFIPFKYIKKTKNLCFEAIVREILHSQNLKNNYHLFKIDFLEGLNQFLTEWIIENYSKKYRIERNICIRRIEVCRTFSIELSVGCAIYNKQVSMVKKILSNSGVDLQEVFNNYIDNNPKFFKRFVPSKYFLKQ